MPFHRRSTQPCFPAYSTALLVLCLTFGACTSGRQGPDIGRLPTITSADPAAEAALREARKARDAGKRKLAKKRYQAFLVERAADPLTAVVRLELGKMMLADENNHDARLLFSQAARHASTAVADQGRFYGAIADARLGEFRAAAAVLREMLGRTVEPEDTALLLQTLANAELALDNYKSAVLALNRLLENAQTPSDARELGRKRLDHILRQEGSPEQVDATVDALEASSPAYEPTLRRAIADAAAASDEARLRELLTLYQEAGLILDEHLQTLALRAAEPQEANLHAVGAILPLSGRARKVGELALRGLMLAANLPPSGPMTVDAPQLLVRDDGGDPRRAADAVDELVNMHHVSAIIGPLDRSSAKAAAERASDLGVPLILLTPASGLTDASRFVFQALPTAAAETRTLVGFAAGHHLRRVAILHPDNGFGLGMAKLFEEAASQNDGVNVTATQAYPASETAFGKHIAQLAKHRFDALFVPDSSQRVALLAPALAAAGLWSTALGQEPSGRGRGIQLLVPSVGFNGNLAARSGRYLQGAAFTTPYAENSSDPAAQSFADRYRAQFGSEPNTISAVAHDAYKLVVAAAQSPDHDLDHDHDDEAFGERSSITECLNRTQAYDTVALLRGLGSARAPTEPLRMLVLEGDIMVDAPKP